MTKRRRQRLWFMGGMFTCLAAATLVLTLVFRDHIVFFYTPSECMTKAKAGEILRVGGLVQVGSIIHQTNGTTPQVTFDLGDGAHTITVVYEGILPDLFRAGQGAVVEGHFEAERARLFRASVVLAKHDETYRPPKGGTSLDADRLGKSLARGTL
ncbi:MAG: cytochrome c maturation protein CcmE [Alphaproteobacteria bacterium]|nr:cytochrome c maturation protein CcmE [Alphaproteobacteria bacterium]